MPKRTRYKPKLAAIIDVMEAHGLAFPALNGISRSVLYGIRRGEPRQRSAAQSFCNALSQAVTAATGKSTQYNIAQLFYDTEELSGNAPAFLSNPMPMPLSANTKSLLNDDIRTLGDVAELFDALVSLGRHFSTDRRSSFRGLIREDVPRLIGQVCEMAFWDLPAEKLDQWLNFGCSIARTVGQIDGAASLGLLRSVTLFHLNNAPSAMTYLDHLDREGVLSASRVPNLPLAARCNRDLFLADHDDTDIETARRTSLDLLGQTTGLDGRLRAMLRINAAIIRALPAIRLWQTRASERVGKKLLNKALTDAADTLRGALEITTSGSANVDGHTSWSVRAGALANLGAVYLVRGEQEAAIATLYSSLRYSIRLNHRFLRGCSHFNLALAYQALDRPKAAAQQARLALDHYTPFNNHQTTICQALLDELTQAQTNTSVRSSRRPAQPARRPQLFPFLYDDLCGSAAFDVFY